MFCFEVLSPTHKAKISYLPVSELFSERSLVLRKLSVSYGPTTREHCTCFNASYESHKILPAIQNSLAVEFLT